MSLISTRRRSPRRRFEPKIVGFLCNWCSYSAADLAGQSRLAYPANLRIIRVPCSGRVDPAFIVKAFAEGADGVLVCGCHPGDCHYLAGNYQAAARVALLRQIMADLGLEPERLQLSWVSAAEAQRLADLATQLTTRLRRLGPRSPIEAAAGPAVEQR